MKILDRRNIGIRSSKVMTEEAAEVIMLKVDLLSGRVVNWTIHSDNVRIELPLSLETSLPFSEVSNLIIEVLKGNESFLKRPDPSVLLTSINEKTMKVNVMAWVKNVHRMQFIKGEILNTMYDLLAQK